MTVAVLGGIEAIDLTHETQLVKAALLYADHVTLASPKAYLLASIAGFSTGDRRARIEATVQLLGSTPKGEEGAELYRQLRAQKRLSPQERIKLRGLEAVLEAGNADVAASIDEVLHEAHAEELSAALDAGAVDLYPLIGDAGSDAFDEIIEEMTVLMTDSVAASAQTFPLFDDGAGDMMRAMVKEGKLADPHLSRAAEAGIAGRLIGGLETFPEAEMDVILDVRRQLEAPLVRFRAALARGSSEFAAAAWDESFAREVDDLYRRDVAPALEDVKHALDELGVRPTLLRAASDMKTHAAVTATLGLAAVGGMTHVDLPELLYSAPGLSAAAAAASQGLQRRKVRREAERNAFYFLYESGRRLD